MTYEQDLVELDWLVTTTWLVLHHAHLTPEQATELSDEGMLEDVTLTCGRRVKSVMIPGFMSRMGKPRCQRCCDRIGYPRGIGSPKNDPATRQTVLARIGHAS